jgi:tetratricopeptide (TPR) repeat protein
MTEEQVTGRVCAPGFGDSLQHDDAPFGLNLIRRALKALNDPHRLGNHPLAQLKLVRFRLRSEDGDDVLRRGAALRDVLCEAIESLKPGDSELDLFSQSWRPYLILTRQYLEGYSPTCLAQQMYIGRSTYFQEQRRTLSLFAGTLQQMEQRCTDPSLIAGDRRIPFMAPPCPVYSLVGRADLLHDLKRRLFAKDRLVLSAVNGLPGVGKTALAVELAHDHEVLEHFEDGVLWAGLGRRPDVSALLGAWGTALGIQPLEMAKLTTVEERARTVHMIIGTRRMLLVIDDAWQTETALAFKLGGPNCAYLLTTRIPEVSLAFADGGVISVSELGEEDSVALLSRLAPQAGEDEPDEVRRLARAVGGLPLALTLIGWHLRKETHSGHPRRLQRALERLRQAEVRLQITQPQALLERRPDVTADTPLSLQVVIGISTETLDETARCALRALAVFPSKPNTFSEKAALAVAEVPVETLDTLADRGLLESSEPGRYTLHQTIAEYASLQLAGDAVALQRACKRLVVFFVHYLEMHTDNHTALEPEVQNILAAFQAAFDQGMHTELVRGVDAFFGFLEARGLYAVTETHLGRAERAARVASDEPALMTILRCRGVVAQHLGHWGQAEACLQESLDLARSVQDHEVVVATLESLGKVAFDRGNYAGAETLYREGLALACENGDRESHISLLECLGWVEGGRGNYARMEDCLVESLDLARDAEDREKTCLLLSSLGLAAVNRGNWRQAQTYLQEGLALAREADDRPSSIMLLISLAIAGVFCDVDVVEIPTLLAESLELIQALGYPEKIGLLLSNQMSMFIDHGGYLQVKVWLQRNLALSHRTRCPARVRDLFTTILLTPWLQSAASLWETLAQTSLALAREIGHRDRICMLLSTLGTAMCFRGNYGQGEAYLEESLAMARQIANRQRVGVLLLTLGAMAINREDLARAETYLQEGLVLAREVGDWSRIHTLLSCLGSVAIGHGDYDRAEAHLRESLIVDREVGFWYETYLSLSNLAAVALQRGHLDRAEEYLRKGSTLLQSEATPSFTATSLYLGWGDLYLERGDLEAASLAFRQVIAEEKGLASQEMMPVTLYGLAHVAAARGDVAEARRLGQESREMFHATGFYREEEVAAWLKTLPKT